MNRALLRSLEQPRDVSRRWWIIYTGATIAFAVAFGVFIYFGRFTVVGLPLVATAHAVAMGLAYGLLSFLFFTQARGENQLGYLVLGFTFGFDGLIWAWFPYFFPNGLSYAVPAMPAVGNANSAPALYMVNRWTVVIGVAIAGYVIGRTDVMARHSRPRVAAAVVAMTLASGLVLAWAAAGAPGAPQLLEAQSTPTRASAVTAVVAMLTAVPVILILAKACRSGSLIGRWLLTLAILHFIEAAATPFAPRFTANWLAVRWLSLISVLIMLFLLLWQLNRILRSTARAADLDELTGALSRTAFVRVIADHLRAPASIRAGSGVVWVDLDQFRLVNAAAGAPAGDAFLRECSATVSIPTP